MSELENFANVEKLTELGNDAIEKVNEVQPVELTEGAPQLEKPQIEETPLQKHHNISFKGGNCICSCDLTCTRA
ncbi:MAG: hypothetical protein J6K05_05430 [Bacteroidaceae bacterium]|nr:hypothetical protein [Bacteroidaceae bacterium]MBP3552596.1 hypothetical protein [Bacteroidaceae bacterium]